MTAEEIRKFVAELVNAGMLNGRQLMITRRMVLAAQDNSNQYKRGYNQGIRDVLAIKPFRKGEAEALMIKVVEPLGGEKGEKP